MYKEISLEDYKKLAKTYKDKYGFETQRTKHLGLWPAWEKKLYEDYGAICDDGVIADSPVGVIRYSGGKDSRTSEKIIRNESGDLNQVSMEMTDAVIDIEKRNVSCSSFIKYIPRRFASFRGYEKRLAVDEEKKDYAKEKNMDRIVASADAEF